MKYKIVLLADETIAPTVIEIIRKSKVSLVSMTPATSEEEKLPLSKPKVIRNRSVGVSTTDFAVELLKGKYKGKKMAAIDLFDDFVSKGFAPNSANGALWAAVQDKKVKREGKRGSYFYWVE